ncbi:MAG: PQQ-binding-like beta-propeller repeat protein [Caldiserica bacterium]|nr:PQQ-binding-like beta-propeller repeat protein [Caldisericota bacterium]
MTKRLVTSMITFLVVFSLCTLAASATLTRGIWPVFRHDLQHTGRSPYDTSGNNGTLKWRYETGSIFASSAIGSDGTIYVGSEDHYLYALNSDGTLKWRYQTGDYVGSSPAIGSDGTVYVGSDDHYLYGLNSDGTLKWRYQTGVNIDSSPAIGSDGTVYVGSHDHYIAGLDDHYLYALNPEGTLKWRYRTGDRVFSSPAIGSDGTIYVGSQGPYLYALNPDGTLKWRYGTGDAIEPSPAISSDGTIYVGSHDDYLYALNPEGTLKWRYQTGDNVVSSPAISSDGTIYVGSDDHYLYALNSNGTLKWRYQTGDTVKSSPAIGSDGTIYVGSADHYLYAIGPLSYSIAVDVVESGVVSKNPDKSFYNSSESVTLTATPSTGYHFVSWKGDIAQGQDTGNPLAITVDSNKTLTATFEINTYTTISSSSTGGSISPSGTITVNYGDSKTFTITPNSGYKISNLKVDGVSKGSVSSYTFSNTISDHKIEASFEKEITQTVTILQIGNTTFTVNGSTRTLDSPPIIRNSRTLLPIRAVVEALGGTVGWNAAERKVTVTLGYRTIELWIGKSMANVNRVDIPIDSSNSRVVPEIISSRTMLPLRFVTENLGCDVQWDGTTKTITVTYQAP